MRSTSTANCMIPLQTDLEEELGISNTEYNTIYSASCIPNLVLVFLSGYLIVRFGRRYFMEFIKKIELY